MEDIVMDGGYKTMMLINSGLLALLVLLFGIVGWYFRKDWEGTKSRVETNETNVQEILVEMRADREREKGQATLMMQMIKILAKKTNTDVGL